MADKIITWTKCKYCGVVLIESDYLYHILSEHLDKFPLVSKLYEVELKEGDGQL